MTRSADHWGPFTPGLDPTERAARARALGALVRVYAGSSADPLVRELRRLEHDLEAANEALALLDALPTRPRRNALNAYVALHASLKSTR